MYAAQERAATGACFIVINGSLQSHSRECQMQCSFIEDGLMIRFHNFVFNLNPKFIVQITRRCARDAVGGITSRK